MKNTTTTTTAATEKRLAAMRRNLAAMEEEADRSLSKGDAMTDAERARLLQLVNVAFHKGGKIDGIYSVDSCAACDFCQHMISAAASHELMICGACYAAADAWKEAAWRRHKLNMRIMSAVLFTRDELAALAIGSLLRFNEDGDTVNETMARNYIRIALSHPATRCGYWYKHAAAVAAGLAAEGIRERAQLPANIRFIHSSVLIGFPARPLWFDDAVFTVYPDESTTLAAIAAGARECNGRKCSACGFSCYLAERPAEAVQVAEVLRCSAARRAAILAAYEKEVARRAAV